MPVPPAKGATWWSMELWWLMATGLQRMPCRAPHGGSMQLSWFLEALQSELENECARQFTDNPNIVHIVQYGSRQPALEVEAMKILNSPYPYIEPEWIPKEQNELADYYSRIVDYDDWMLNPATFSWLNSLWGPHTVDRFANAMNAQLPRFNSRFWVPGYEAIDAFICNLADDNNWWYPRYI